MTTLPLSAGGNGAKPCRHMGSAGPDVRLAHLVAQNLMSDDRIRHQPISIVVQNRLVILTGHADFDIREAVGRIVRDSEGVHDVCNLISVPEAVAATGLAGESREQRQLDGIEAPLRLREPGWGHDPHSPFRSSASTVSLLLATFVWSVLLAAAVQFGWPIILFGVGAGALSLLSARLSRTSLSRQQMRRRLGP